MAESIEIFLSYAREDEVLRDTLEKHLRPWEREGLITIWHDRAISAGKEWAYEISTHLNSAHMILLLISPDFMASDYCHSIEVKRAIERYEAGEARVIPIILRPVIWQEAPFGKLQALPTDAKPITSPDWSSQDEAFFNVAEGLHKAILEVVRSRIVKQKISAMDRLAELSVLLRDYLAANLEFAEKHHQDIKSFVSRVQEALVILADIMGEVAKAGDSADIFSNLEKAESLLKTFDHMYCVKCRAYRNTMIGTKYYGGRNGHYGRAGRCPVCGTGMFTIPKG